MKSKALVLLCLILIIQSVGFPIPAMANTDSNSPVTTHIITGNQGINGIYYGQVQVQLTATDDSSGVSLTQYSLDNGQIWNTYTEPVLITTLKSYTLLYRSIDGNNNTEATKFVRFTLKQDNTIPSTTVQLTGTLGQHSYYVSPVQVTLSAQDNQSGIDYTEYSLNLGRSWQRYVGPVLIDNSDSSLVYYRSKDKSGNTEKTKKAKIYLDLLPPAEPTIALDNKDWSNGSKTVKIIDGIDQNSGAQKSQYRFNETDPWINYEAPFTVNEPKIIYAQTIDMAGNISEIALASSFIDTSSPSSPVIELSYADWAREDIIAWISGGEDLESQLRRYEYKFGEDGEWIEYGGPLTIDSLGITTVSARSVNDAGLPSNVSTIEIKIDKEAPTTPELRLSTENWTNNPVEVDIIPGTDAISGVKAVEYKLDDGEWQESTGELAISKEGETHISARTVDMAYNYSEIVEAVANYDHTAPVSTASLEGNKVGEWYSSDVKVTLEANDGIGSGVDKILYSINGNPESEYTFPLTFDEDGVYSIEYYSVDKLGNEEDKKQFVIQLDMTSPSMPVINLERTQFGWENSAGTWYHTKANVSMTAGVDSGSGISRLEYKIDANGTWNTYYQPFTSTAPHTIYARTVDNAGNVSNSFIASAGTYTLGGLYTHGVSIYDSISRLSVSDRITGFDSKYFTKSINNVWFDSEGKLRFSITEENVDTGATRSRSGYFENDITTVNKKWDLVAPSMPQNLTVDSKTNTTVTISWTPSSDNNGVIGYDIYKNGLYIASTSETNYQVTELITDTVYSFIVNAKDAVGNLSTSSNRVKVMTNTDFQAPSIPTKLTEVSKTDSTVTLSWSASNDNIGVMEYEIFNGTELMGVTTFTRFSINGLSPSTEYIFTVRAKDYDENVSSTSDSITVLTTSDITPPSKPSEVRVSERTDTTVTLTWTVSTDNGVVLKYDIYQDGSKIGSTATSSFIVTGLQSNILYTFYVVAVDEQGNESDQSTLVKSRYFNGSPLSVSNHAVYVKADGTVWSWGNNNNGQLGDGTTTNKSTAVQMSSLSGYVAVSTGYQHTIALKSDGTVWTWGYNWNGQLGTGNNAEQYIPGQVTGLTDIIAVAASKSNSYALKNDGTVWAWGYNGLGQVGDGTTTNHMRPVQVNGLSGVVAIAAGGDTGVAYALKSDGTVWMWGGGAFSPISVTGLSGITAISIGFAHVVALKVDGTVWTWGNSTGAGNNTTAAQVNGLTGVTSIAAGNYYSFAVKADGTVWAWGINTNGQLGDGTTTSRNTPVQVIGLTNVKSVAASLMSNNGAALKVDGTVWSWGINNYGQLGDGTTTQRLTAVQVKENTAPVVTLVYPLGTQASPAVTSSPKPAISWNQTDDILTVFTQIQVQILDNAGALVLDSGVVAQSSTTTTGTWTVSTALPVNQTLQVRVKVKDETVWSDWSPVGWIKIISATGGSLSVSNHAVYVKADGTVWSWGNNNNGQLGDGTTTNRSTAVQLSSLSGYVAVSIAYKHTIALKSDGTVWTWGYNWDGQLGTGNNAEQYIPGQVTGLTDIIAVAASKSNSYALKNDGTVWAWGYNGLGQVGDGTKTNRMRPVQVKGLSGVVAIAAGGDTGVAYALKSDGTVWMWGGGASSPIPVTGLSGITAISIGFAHVVALKVDGTVWTMANTGTGAAQVNGLTGVTSIAAGFNYSFAVKADGTVWAWGGNTNGQLGDGTTTSRTTPVQVIGLTNVKSVAASFISNNGAALKADGTVWSWGINNYGQLGDGTTTQRLSPVRSL